MQFDWLTIVGNIFEILIFPALGVATAYLIAWLKAKKKELLEKTKNETTQKYLNLLDNTITECVLATNQTYVNSLKQSGTFDMEAQKKAFQLTYDAVMSTLTDDAQMYLNEAVKDLTASITTKIEAQVLNINS
jgi:hypothetical protein